MPDKRTYAEKNRNIGVDVVRTMAIVFVLGIHAIGFSPSLKIYGFGDFILIYLRLICMTCVPLFMILSGYLNWKKMDSGDLYKRCLPRLVVTYFFWGILSLIFNIIYLQWKFDIKSVVSLFNFTVQDRAWYMNMYFGIFLVIPFINACWNNISKKEKHNLLIVLFLVSAVSKYIWNVSNIISSGENCIVFISQYLWNSIYIFYYLVGAYIAEYSVSYKRKRVFTFLQILLILNTLYYFIEGYGLFYYDIPEARSLWYDNPFLAIESICTFICFYDVKIENNLIRKNISTIAKVSFDMYLVSYIFDNVVNRKLIILYQNPKVGFWIALIACFGLSFLLSFLAAFIKNVLFDKIRFSKALMMHKAEPRIVEEK